MDGIRAEMICRSRLVFTKSGESGEALDFGCLERVREPVSRSKAGVQAKIADVMRGRSRHAESQNELKAFRLLLAIGRADEWQEQPFYLEYHSEGKKHRYVPDVLAVWGGTREVIEIKEDGEADKPENQKRFAFISELLAEHGYCFRVWRKSEICAEPRLANVGLVLRYRCVSVSSMVKEKIRQALSTNSELPLRAFREERGIDIQSVLRLVLDGILHINWWETLTVDSCVSVAPIGPQVWPARPRWHLPPKSKEG